MAQQGEINQTESVKGLFTEGSPLNFPAGATVRDENFILHSDGTRERRFGLDIEKNAVPSTSWPEEPVQIFNWESVGNVGGKDYAAVFSFTSIKFFDKSVEPLSDGFLAEFTYSFTEFFGSDGAQAANINGYLVVAGINVSTIVVFAEEDGVIAAYNQEIYVRDIWGVEDNLDVDERPDDLTPEHAYNLANQGWHYSEAQQVRGVGVTTTTAIDPETGDEITIVQDEGGWPSNADLVTYGLSETDENDRFKQDLYSVVPFGTTPAPKGSAIIRLLSTGLDRYNHAINYDWPSSELNESAYQDNSIGGATAVASYAGRIFYAGFSNKSGSAGDTPTYPNLSSIIVFSRSVQTKDDVTKCYQEIDPASLDSEILATDGGTLNIAGVGKIYKLLPAGRSLLIFASEGVWELYSTDQLFSASNYQVKKITDVGCDSPKSVIVAESTPMYWTDYGIYALTPSEISESYVAQNITERTIQSFFNNIPKASIESAFGLYDKFDKKARWLYSSDGTSYDRELIFDTRLQSWYTNVYPTVAGKELLGMIDLNEYKDIDYGSQKVPDKGKRAFKYLVGNSVTDRYEFYEFNDTSFKDYGTVDAEAVMITGPYSGGDSVRRKSSTYLTMQLRKTETGFEEVGGDIVPINAGSCIVETRWDWTNLAKTGKFNDPIEMYRHRRHYIPADVNDNYEDGNTVITTKSRLRGSGRAISIKITSSPEKDLNLLGWNFQITQNEKV